MLHMSGSMSGRNAPTKAMLLRHLHHAASIAGFLPPCAAVSLDILAHKQECRQTCVVLPSLVECCRVGSRSYIIEVQFSSRGCSGTAWFFNHKP
jgi:hypothetical protein